MVGFVRLKKSSCYSMIFCLVPFSKSLSTYDDTCISFFQAKKFSLCQKTSQYKYYQRTAACWRTMTASCLLQWKASHPFQPLAHRSLTRVIRALSLRRRPPNCGPSPTAATSSGQQTPAWPAIYAFPDIESGLRTQILACVSPDDASLLKCSAAFCSDFLKPIINDVTRFVGEDR